MPKNRRKNNTANNIPFSRTFGWSRTPGPSTGDSTDTFGWPGTKTTSAVSLPAPHTPSSNQLLVQTAKNKAYIRLASI